MKKFFLYNLMDYDITLDRVQSILHSYSNDNIDVNDLKNNIDKKIYDEVINDKYNFESYLSIKVLYELELPNFVLEKIFLKYNTFKELIRAIEQDSFHITDKIKNQIFKLEDKIGEDNIKKNMYIREDNREDKIFAYYKKLLIKVLNKYYCTSTRDILKGFKDEDNAITTTQLSFILNELKNEGVIGYSSNQYIVLSNNEDETSKKANIIDYIHSANNQIKDMFKYLDSFDKSDFLREKNKSKYEYEEQIKNIIKFAPIFIYEKKLQNILSIYDVSYRLIDKKYPSILYHYIKFKYDLNPKSTYIEFLQNEEEYDKEEVETYLSFKKKYIFNNEIKNIYFTNLIKDFYNSNNFIYIDKNHYMTFIEFCNRVIPSHKNVIPKDSEKFIREVSQLSFFFKHEQGYIYFDHKNFPNETFEVVNKIVLEIEYPISYKYLFEKNKDILKDNYIKNSFGLSVLIKNLNHEEIKIYKSYIKPSRKKIEDFISTEIMEFEIQTKENLLLHLKNRHYFKDEYFDGDLIKIINKYFNKDQTLRFEQIDENCSNKFIDFMKDGFCTIQGLENFIKDNNITYSETNFIHPINLRKFNLRKDKSYLYSDEFSSFEDAFLNYLKRENKTIYIENLLKILGKDAYEYQYTKYSRKFFLIKYTEHYLVNLTHKDNLKSKNSLINFRDSIINEMDSKIIYNYNDLFNSSRFKKLADENIIPYYGQKMAMVSLLETSNHITIKETTRFLFRKNGKITRAEVLKAVMNGKTSISYTNMVEILEDDYGYISTNDLDYLFNKLELVYKPILDMVFINITEYYNKLEEIDNEWEN